MSSSARAIRSPPTSITRYPSDDASSVAIAFAVASSPARNASNGTLSSVGLACRDAKIVLNPLTTLAPDNRACSSSAAERPVVVRSVGQPRCRYFRRPPFGIYS